VAVCYLALKWAARRWPLLNKYFPLIAVLAYVILIVMFLSNLKPSLPTIDSLKSFISSFDSVKSFMGSVLSALKGKGNSIVSDVSDWLKTFTNLCALSIVLPYWFHSPGLAKIVSWVIMALLNLVINLSIAIVAAFGVPGVGLVPTFLNFIVLSDIFILFAITALIKWFADYIFDKYFPFGQEHLKAAGSADTPAE
jgi:hypothetical protein